MKTVADFDDDSLMTVREAAEYLRCSRATLFRFMHDGRLNGFKVGQKVVFYARDVKGVVRARVSTTASPQRS